MRKVAVLALCSLLLATVACSPIEKQAYNTIVAAKAFLDSEKKVHSECPAAGTTLCQNLSRATAAKDALIDAAEIYCSSPAFESGGACTPPAKGTPASDQAIAKLKAAIATYNQLEKDVRGSL